MHSEHVSMILCQANIASFIMTVSVMQCWGNAIQVTRVTKSELYIRVTFLDK